MQIAFLDTAIYEYTIDTVYQKPLGGSSSAVCYLAEALAQQGQTVFLLNRIGAPTLTRGVTCLPFATLAPDVRESFDVLVVVNLAGQAVQIRQVLADHTRLILWTQHAHDQPAIQGLQSLDEQAAYDGIVFVSEWQRDQYHQCFGIDRARSHVLRNAISPVFRNLFPGDRPILAHKSQPPVLVYTSTPFRGLDILLNLFPSIRQQVPGTILKVFSSMSVYALPDTEYEPLYRQCQTTEGVEYVGSVPQPELVQALRTATALAYPNTFAETSCIAVMEAMASGCHVVTSDLGALPETAAGFAHLIPITADWEAYQSQFVDDMVDVLTTVWLDSAAIAENHLRQQVEFANTAYCWETRAQEWIAWLNTL